jgi:hypothetical protein
MAEKEFDLTTHKWNPREVERIHQAADTDGSPKAAHHTLGPFPNQASPGNHTHDGGSSAILPLVLDTVSITGSKSSGAALDSIIAALVTLGATDLTTP